MPDSNIYYVSVGRDYSYLEKLNYTSFETYGILTNESETLSQLECDNLSIVNKFTVYPWENVDEELFEINNSLIYHNNGGQK